MPFPSRINHILPSVLQPVGIAKRAFLRQSRGVVQAGPFRGMRYLDQAFCSALAPKMAGCYERELHPFLNRLRDMKPDRFIVAGAAEGYYAVGLLFAGWFESVIAFESDADARGAVLRLLQLNGVERRRLDLRGICTASELNRALDGAVQPAVLMDIEGFEALVLDPLRAPNLARCHLLVEYHDFLLPGLSEELRIRLTDTHTFERIDQQPRQAEELGARGWLQRMPGAIRERVLREERPFSAHGWLWMTPRTGASMRTP